MIDQLAYLTADLTGIGGQIKDRPEDFLVEEDPLFEPTGSGEHLYLFVEKRLRSTSDMVRHLARVFRVGRSDVGYAGLKDKYAVTRQHFSIWLPDASQDRALLERVDRPYIKLLWASRHEQKLRRGNLAGNRFVIRIRNVDASAVVQSNRILNRLAATGVPNFVGQQRFGYRLVNHKIGRLLVLGRWQEMLDLMLGHPLEADHAPTRSARQAYECGDYARALELLPKHLHQDRQAIDTLRQGKSAQEAVMAIDRHQLAFYVSALQSAIFNRVLDRRLGQAGMPGIDRMVEGDLAWKHDNRSVFLVDQAVADAENGPDGRVATRQVSPSGPMWGVGMPKAAGKVVGWEQQALEDENVTESDLHNSQHSTTHGCRRPMRVSVRDPQVSGGADEHGPYIRMAFGLPRGSFATIVLREIMKLRPAQPQCSDQHQTSPLAG